MESGKRENCEKDFVCT